MERLTPRMLRVTFTGAELDGLTVKLPAASVRLLLPPQGETRFVMPTWSGNEFLLPDGQRPTIRTFTPRRADPEAPEVDLDIVVHDGGIVSAWAEAAEPGDLAAISGPGRGYVIDADAHTFLLAGDETAIPHVPRVQRPQVRDRRPSSGPSSARVNADAAELVELDASRGGGSSVEKSRRSGLFRDPSRPVSTHPAMSFHTVERVYQGKRAP